jgi:hypothetical protein
MRSGATPGPCGAGSAFQESLSLLERRCGEWVQRGLVNARRSPGCGEPSTRATHDTPARRRSARSCAPRPSWGCRRTAWQAARHRLSPSAWTPRGGCSGGASREAIGYPSRRFVAARSTSYRHAECLQNPLFPGCAIGGEKHVSRPTRAEVPASLGLARGALIERGRRQSASATLDPSDCSFRAWTAFPRGGRRALSDLRSHTATRTHATA